METYITTNKIIVRSADLNANGMSNTYNYLNPEKFSASAIASDTTFLPALYKLFGLSTNTFTSANYTVTYDLQED